MEDGFLASLAFAPIFFDNRAADGLHMDDLYDNSVTFIMHMS